MSIKLLDGSTIPSFLEDEEAFESWIANRFASLDVNKDGNLSYEEMMPEIESLRVLMKDLELDAREEHDKTNDYSLILKKFDRNSNGKVNKEDFKAETKRIMLLVAVRLLMKAVENEFAKLIVFSN
ncbi:uncharacterized protein LOC124909553 [Impatiens glandulifera]|uniref:uncharacterized protein LOC124909553 n=1 Tax=Impatiens glandulifera TaxID=253017 RepID=UPI001FB14C89|nr:uncharacterized protein LOC124909553 [Impatiens glandulifera]